MPNRDQTLATAVPRAKQALIESISISQTTPHDDWCIHGKSKKCPCRPHPSLFLEGRSFGEIVNRIAAVQQLARAAVDEADLRAIEVDAFQAAVNFGLFAVVAHAIVLQQKCGRYIIQ